MVTVHVIEEAGEVSGPAPVGAAAALAARCLAWLAAHEHENLGAEIRLRRALDAGDGVARLDVALGVDGAPNALAFGRGALAHVSADDAGRAEAITRATLAPAPRKVVASGRSRAGVRAALAGRVGREHDLLAMACGSAPTGAGARWATGDDVTRLEAYEALYNAERRTEGRVDWAAAVAQREVAVCDAPGQPVVAVVRRGGVSARYACIGGTFCFPGHRGRGYARCVTSFLTAALLHERPAVHLIVDDDNAAAIGLYRALGFREVGRCYMAYLV